MTMNTKKELHNFNAVKSETHLVVNSKANSLLTL